MGSSEGCKAAMAMVGLQFIYAGVALFTRAALVRGMNPRVYIVYRQGIATLVMAPLAYISRRRNSLPLSLGLRSFVWIFLASLIGITANQNAYFEGLYLTSSTAASAMTNLIPAVTFVLAAIFGMEKVEVRSMTSVAKILGTALCVGGAMSMALLKGPKLLNAPFSFFTFPPHNNDWLLGCLLLFGSTCFWSSWMIFQVPISANCPDHLYSSAWMGLLGTMESAIVTLSLERDLQVWSLKSFLEVSCCLYGGVSLAVSFFLQAWCISQKGPLFIAMFSPLCTVIVTIIAAIFLHEETYTGSIIGAIAVIIGLYAVLWGKAKDLKEIEELHMKLQNNKPRIAPVIISHGFSEQEKAKSDLKEPLLSP